MTERSFLILLHPSSVSYPRRGLRNREQGVYYAWVYSGGQFTVFPQQYSYGLQINAVGQVVFNANDSSGNAHGYLYSNGQVTDIGTLPGGIQTQISAINDAGQILVYGAGHDYLLTPSNLPTVPPPPPDAVPEPSVLAFVGLAIGALGFRTALRKRTASLPRMQS